MPYNPTVYSNPGIAPGINAISGLVQDWQKKQEEQTKLQGYNDALIQHAAQQGLITPDELNKYQAASLTQKTGIAAGIAANLHEDMKRQQMQQEDAYHRASLANAIEVAKIHAAASGGGMGGPSVEPGQVFTRIDPATGKPFSVFARGPRQFDLTPGSMPSAALPPPGSPVFAEDGSQIGVWNAKGGITKKTPEQLVDPEKQARANLLDEAMGKPTKPTGGPKQGDVVRGYRFKGGDPADQKNWEKVQ